MESFDLPNLDDLSPDQASMEINKINAVGLDPGHPYTDGNHPQHKDFVSVMGKLNEIKYADADERTPMEKGMEEALEMQEDRQNDLAVLSVPAKKARWSTVWVLPTGRPSRTPIRPSSPYKRPKRYLR